MKKNNRKRFNLCTQRQRWAARVLLIVYTFGSGSGSVENVVAAPKAKAAMVATLVAMTGPPVWLAAAAVPGAFLDPKLSAAVPGLCQAPWLSAAVPGECPVPWTSSQTLRRYPGPDDLSSMEAVDGDHLDHMLAEGARNTTLLECECNSLQEWIPILKEIQAQLSASGKDSGATEALDKALTEAESVLKDAEKALKDAVEDLIKTERYLNVSLVSELSSLSQKRATLVKIKEILLHRGATEALVEIDEALTEATEDLTNKHRDLEVAFLEYYWYLHTDEMLTLQEEVSELINQKDNRLNESLTEAYQHQGEIDKALKEIKADLEDANSPTEDTSKRKISTLEQRRKNLGWEFRMLQRERAALGLKIFYLEHSEDGQDERDEKEHSEDGQDERDEEIAQLKEDLKQVEEDLKQVEKDLKQVEKEIEEEEARANALSGGL